MGQGDIPYSKLLRDVVGALTSQTYEGKMTGGDKIDSENLVKESGRIRLSPRISRENGPDSQVYYGFRPPFQEGEVGQEWSLLQVIHQ